MQIKVAFACSIECAFSKVGLIKHKKLDKDATLNFFITSIDDATLVPEITDQVKKCFELYEAEVDTSQECNSGAIEFAMCFKREVFLHCPRSISTESSECEDLKAKVIKCPKVPVVA